MAIHFVKGNLLDSTCQYICHQVNCKGIMDFGVAKQIKDKWPQVYENYQAMFDENKFPSSWHLGHCQFVALYDNYFTTPKDKRQQAINMFAQDNYGYNKQRYTNYDAFYSCLATIARSVEKGSTIAFPFHIGCGRDGGNWRIILTMIEEVLGKNYEVYIYEFNEEV
jgi:O-acetyl-ADP-ribose deacetylase (regulator of RNase III)